MVGEPGLNSREGSYEKCRDKYLDLYGSSFPYI